MTCTRGIPVRVSINIMHQLTLNWYLNGILINTQLTSPLILSHHKINILVDCQLRVTTNFHRLIIERCWIHMHELVHTRPIIDWMSIKCWLSIGEVVEGVQTKCLPSTVNWMTKMLTMSIYQLSTKTLATVPPSRSISLVSELEQISPNTKSSSSSEISNIWWDIEQNTHQVWHNSNLKSKRNMSLTIQQLLTSFSQRSILHGSFERQSDHSFYIVWLVIISLYIWKLDITNCVSNWLSQSF